MSDSERTGQDEVKTPFTFKLIVDKTSSLGN